MRILGVILVSIFGIVAAVNTSPGCIKPRQVDRTKWGKYDINTDYYTTTPDTGRTVEYWLTVDNVTLAPDGVPRQMMVFNNQFPGPLIEANWGDTIVVHVTNNLKNNGTSVHWHGILMEHNVANDGVPGITQCPIPPGQSFTYKFRATSYGTTWYHSHFSLQYSEGLVGPLIINGPTSAQWDVDLGTVMLQDFYHTPVFELWFAERQTPPLLADNGLINGKNKLSLNGTKGEFTQFEFTPGKKYRMRIINTSTDQHFKFSIDQHSFTVQAADFIAIQPYTQTVLNIFIGQRYDIVVEANQKPGTYWMRAVPASDCSGNLNPNGIRAVVRYQGSNKKTDPTSLPYSVSTTCEDETGLVPIVPRNVGALTVETKEDLSVTVDNYIKFTMNGSSLLIDWEDPTLLLVDNHDPSYPSNYNVVSLNGTSDTWTYFVIQSVPPIAIPHPIHLHGHDFSILAKGTGIFDESILKTANFTNPTRRDVATMPASAPGDPNVGGFLVIGFPLDNPGIWILHCHIAWHISMGLGMQFVERINEIPGHVGVTPAWEENCKAWTNYQNTIRPLQDDSGL